MEIDDCNFHECVKLHDFDLQRILTFLPPDGEFVVMNYRITSEFRSVPFVFHLFVTTCFTGIVFAYTYNNVC